MGTLTAEKTREVIRALYDGTIGIKAALAQHGIRPATFFEYLEKDAQCANLYALAQQARGEMLVDEIIDISDNERDAQKARNRIDARKWYASKMQPQKYGDRIDLNVNQTIDINAALAEARARVRSIRDQSKIEDAEVIESKPQQIEDATGCESVVPQLGVEKEGDPFA